MQCCRLTFGRRPETEPLFKHYGDGGGVAIQLGALHIQRGDVLVILGVPDTLSKILMDLEATAKNRKNL